MCSTSLLNAQKSVYLEDLLYQAITSDKPVGLELSADTEILLYDYHDYQLTPQVMIERYPDLSRFMQDSMLVVKNILGLKGRFNDDKAIDGYTVGLRLEISGFRFLNQINFALTNYSPTVDNPNFHYSHIRFKKCDFPAVLFINATNTGLILEDCNVRSMFALNESVESTNFQIKDCSFNTNLVVVGIAAQSFSLEGNKMNADVIIQDNDLANLSITKNEFRAISAHSNERERPVRHVNDSSTYFNDFYDNNFNFILDGTTEIDRVEISENTFFNNEYPTASIITIPSGRMIITENDFEGFAYFEFAAERHLTIKNNQMSSVSLNGASFPETPQNKAVIGWEQFENNLVSSPELQYIYRGETEYELSDKHDFYELISSYQKLLTVYKDQGNIEDANKVLLKIKELNIRRYEHLFRTEGGTTNFFRLQLNNLLQAYTRHGTDPWLGEALSQLV